MHGWRLTELSLNAWTIGTVMRAALLGRAAVASNL